MFRSSIEGPGFRSSIEGPVFRSSIDGPVFRSSIEGPGFRSQSWFTSPSGGGGGLLGSRSSTMEGMGVPCTSP